MQQRHCAASPNLRPRARNDPTENISVSDTLCYRVFVITRSTADIRPVSLAKACAQAAHVIERGHRYCTELLPATPAYATRAAAARSSLRVHCAHGQSHGGHPCRWLESFIDWRRLASHQGLCRCRRSHHAHTRTSRSDLFGAIEHAHRTSAFSAWHRRQRVVRSGSGGNSFLEAVQSSGAW